MFIEHGTPGFAKKMTANLLACVLACCWPAIGGTRSSETNQWELKYETGTLELKGGAHLIVILATDSVTLSTKRGAIVRIPSERIEQVVYDNTVQSRAVWWVKSGYWPSIVSGPYWGLSLLGSGVVLGLGTAILSPFKSKKHYVHLFWRRGDVNEVAVLQASKKEYQTFLQSLEALTGKPWRDLPAERSRLREELEAEKNNSLSLRFPRDIQTDAGLLKSGLYRLVLLRREEGPSELYFFRGKDVRTEKVAAVERVEVIREANEVTGAEPGYRVEGDLLYLDAIRTPHETYRIVRSLPGEFRRAPNPTNGAATDPCRL